MPNVLILGSEGNIGKAVRDSFAHLDFETYSFDSIERPYDSDGRHFTELNQALNANPDLVFSCLPYMCNEVPARTCATFGIPYFDLGGRCDVSSCINANFACCKVQCFTDLGLAPGWVNILAEKYFRHSEKGNWPIQVEMYCGGLPRREELDKCGPSKYALTWSPEGLLNEYRDDCEVLVDGVLKSVPGMSTVVKEQHIYDCPERDAPHLVNFERFPTSGGLAHSARLFQDRGVKDANYQTLRYPGHVDYLKDNMEAAIATIPIVDVGDVVYVGLFVKWEKDGETYVENQMVYGDRIFTAMQKCTAFPAVAAASLFREMPGRPLNYADIPLEKFDGRVKYLFEEHNNYVRDTFYTESE